MWEIKSYVLDDGADVIESWFSQNSATRYVRLQVKLVTRMLYLRDQPTPPQWVGPCFHFLSGARGIGAITLEVNNIQYRPLGFFGPNAQEFTFLYFATEKGGKYLPSGCVESAVSRSEIVKADPNRAIKSKRF